MKKAFSLVEILISTVIISLAILPIIMLSRSDNFSSSFNESFLLGLSRGKRILTAIEAFSYSDLIDQAGISSPGSSGTIANPLPEVSIELKDIAQKDGTLSYLKHHEKKLSKYETTLTIRIHEEGLLSVDVNVGWTIPGENNKLKKHSLKLTTFVTNRQNTSGQKIEI